MRDVSVWLLLIERFLWGNLSGCESASNRRRRKRNDWKNWAIWVVWSAERRSPFAFSYANFLRIYFGGWMAMLKARRKNCFSPLVVSSLRVQLVWPMLSKTIAASWRKLWWQFNALGINKSKIGQSGIGSDAFGRCYRVSSNKWSWVATSPQDEEEKSNSKNLLMHKAHSIFTSCAPAIFFLSIKRQQDGTIRVLNILYCR